MNTGAPWPGANSAWFRVLGIQTKLHQWATDDPNRRFDDLYNLICDPAVLVNAWDRVRGNKGARSAGVDGRTVRYISVLKGEQAFLSELREDLKAHRFHPMPVREVMIPKPGSKKRRRLGIATVRDRVVQAALATVLEPIFEADFKPCSYGFRPGRRAHDAIAEIHLFTTRSYEWVLEGDIKACFDEISHSALLGRVRSRIGDKRVVGLVRAFLKAGILGEDGELRNNDAGTPQGGIVSPLLANIALSVLDEHFAKAWEEMGDSHGRERRRKKGLANYRLVRYADDFVVLVAGDRSDAERLREEVAVVIAPMGLRLSEAKTTIVHIDEGFDFLGVRIQRHKKRGVAKRFVYTYASKASVSAVKDKVRSITRKEATSQPLKALIARINPVLRGWTNYHRHGVSAKTFSYLHAFTWARVWCWLRNKHPHGTWKELRRRYLRNGRLAQDEAVLFDAQAVAITRYRYRGINIASPWQSKTERTAA